MDSNKWIIYIILIIFCFFGCSRDEKYEDNPYTDVKLEFLTAPGVLQQVSVNSIELIVSSPELPEPRIIKITNISPTERSAKTSFKIPLVNSLNFSAKAYQGECPVLGGMLENVKLAPNQTNPVVIKLNLLQIIMGIRSSQEQLNSGEIYNAEIYIKDAPRVFSFTCELSFDEELLTPIDIVPGDFFGSDALFLQEIEFPRREPGKVALGITLKRDAAGVCGSGSLFQLSFRASSPGNARVNITQNDKLILRTPFPEFSQIESSQIVIEKGASVTVR